MGENIFLSYCFHFFRLIPQSRTAGLYGSSIFLRKLHTVYMVATLIYILSNIHNESCTNFFGFPVHINVMFTLQSISMQQHCVLKNNVRASLGVQWLSVHLPMQEKRVPWYRKIPHATGQLSSHATSTEPEHPRACSLQQEKPAHCNWRADPTHCNQSKPECSNRDTVQPKVNK